MSEAAGMTLEGVIVKGIGGFYYIQTERGLIETKARGKFRNQNVAPIVGDRVRVRLMDEAEMTGSLDEILPRKNSFIRPPVANLDQIVITFAAAEPEPNLRLVDKLTVTALAAGVACVICINKIDIAEEKARELAKIYRMAGFPVILSSSVSGVGAEELRSVLSGRVTAFAGNSGVGKSSILNGLTDGETLETGKISGKIKRGRHTTRHVELFALPAGGYVFDTPGFSSFEVEGLRVSELETYFPEFAPYLGGCRFTGCAHISEPNCPVKDALAEGKIHASRYESYCELYQMLKQVKEWMKP